MFEFVMAIFAVMMITFLFLMLNEAYASGLYSHAATRIRINESSNVDHTARLYFDIIDGLWRNWPVIVLFLFVFILIIVGQKRSGL